MGWLEKHNVPYEKYNIEYITAQDIVHLLSLSEGGISELTKSYERSTDVIKRKLKILDQMNFNEGVYYLEHNVELLQTPLIMTQHKYLVGYHAENIRQFAPRYYRISSIFLHHYKTKQEKSNK